MDEKDIGSFWEKITKEAIDQGKVIEVGWLATRVAMMKRGMPKALEAEVRKVFFLGAHHLYSAMMEMLEAGEEPTDNDMNRMNKIHDELEAFRKSLMGEHDRPRH